MASPLRLPITPRQRLCSVTAACACKQSCITCAMYTVLSSHTLVIADATAASQEHDLTTNAHGTRVRELFVTVNTQHCQS
jgi:hypothetical protein